MYGDRLRKLVFGLLAIILVTILTLRGSNPSWSQNALTALGILLNPALIFMGYVFVMNANSNPDRYRLYFSFPIIRTKIRMEHLSNFIAWMFWMIAVFPVTQGAIENVDIVLSPQLVETLHLVFTGAAILGVFLEMYHYYPRWSAPFNWNMILISVAILFFLCTYLLHVSTIATGELAIGIVGFGHLLVTNKK